jgi:hypothetical protein
MDWRVARTGEVVFDNCRLPAQNRVGVENEGVGIHSSWVGASRLRAMRAVSGRYPTVGWPGCPAGPRPLAVTPARRPPAVPSYRETPAS